MEGSHYTSHLSYMDYNQVSNKNGFEINLSDTHSPDLQKCDQIKMPNTTSAKGNALSDKALKF